MFGYKILKDRYLRVIFGISFFILLFTVVYAFSKFIEVSGPIILHFDIFKGVDAVGGRTEVFGILAVALAMTVINFFLAEFVYRRERFMSYLISFATLILGIIFLIAVAAIGSVNL